MIPETSIQPTSIRYYETDRESKQVITKVCIINDKIDGIVDEVNQGSKLLAYLYPVWIE